MNKPVLRYLRMESVSIYRQLQIEEALLRADTDNWCLINERSPPAIVMGISGKVEELIDQERYLREPIPVIRRFSGGGTVVVDHNTLFITLICNRNAVNIVPFPNQILCWNGGLYHHALRKVDFCIRENDYTIGVQKFGGNAQYISKDRWLHHTSLLWDYDVERMRFLKVPLKMPIYRANRGHADFLCKLNSYILEKEHFYRDFLSSLAEHFLIEPPIHTIESYLERSHRKATQKELLKGF